MTKKDVIQLLEKIAIYMELKGENTFKVSAYRKAAQSLEVDERTLEEIDDVTELKGIGKGVGEVINEFKTQGQSSTLQALQDEVPEGLVPLLKIQGLGSKKIAKLYHELQITDKETDFKSVSLSVCLFLSLSVSLSLPLPLSVGLYVWMPACLPFFS